MTNEQIAQKTGLTVDQIAAIRAFAPTGGTVEPRVLHSNDALAARRAELAAERAALPSDAELHAMLIELNG